MHLPHRLLRYRSWIKVVLACTIAAGVAALIVSSLLPKVYQSEARLVVGQSLSTANPDPNGFATSEALSRAYVELASARPVLQGVADRVDEGATADTIAQSVTVTAVRELPFIQVVASDQDPQRAADMANAMAAELVARSPSIRGSLGESSVFVDEDLEATQQQIQTTRTEVERLLALPSRTAAQEAALETLQGRLVSLRSTYTTMLQFSTTEAANRITIVQPAVAPTEASSPRVLLNVVLASLAGFLLAVALAMVWERLDDRVRSVEDIERITDLPTLGQVIRMPGERGRKPFYRLATLLYPLSPAAESFRTLRTNLEFAALDRPIRTVVITSSAPQEGKTVVASNLAVALAQGGRRTILVDADMRRPMVHEMFGLKNERGFSDLIRKDEIDLGSVAQATEEPNLRVVTCGTVPPNPAELLGSRRTDTIITRLIAAADVIVFDTPPVATVTDAAILATKVDATLLVVKSHATSESVVARGRESLAKVGARVVGVVVNAMPARLAGYYGTYANSAEAEAAAKATATTVPASVTANAVAGRPRDGRPEE